MDEGKCALAMRGRVSDTSGNWLPDARITLVECGCCATTDGNGLFEMNIPRLPEPNTSAEQFGVLRIEKLRHRSRQIRIHNREFFSQFAEIFIEPDGVGEDAVHLAFALPGEGILPIGKGITASDDPGQVEELLRQQLEALAAESSQLTSSAEFYAWLPPGDEPLQAAFLLSLHGMGCVDHPVLRRFAKLNKVALVGLMGRQCKEEFIPQVCSMPP